MVQCDGLVINSFPQEMVTDSNVFQLLMIDWVLGKRNCPSIVIEDWEWPVLQ
jgi:hypothetical protein